MRFDVAAIGKLVSLFGGLIGRGEKGQRVAALMSDIAGQLEDFKSARQKIDSIASQPRDRAAGLTIPLTYGEVAALDRYLDLSRQTSRELRRLIRRQSQLPDDAA